MSVQVFVLTTLHAHARRRADGARDDRLGADQRLDRPAGRAGRRRVQPIAQFLAAFPVNLLFGAAVSLVLAFNLNPDIWLSLLIVFGTQWYIVFNTIGGAAAFPNDLREAAANFHIHGWDWWKQVILPGVAALLSHRRDHRLGRLVERLDRRRIGQMEGPDRRRARRRRLYRRGDRQGRLPENRARRRHDVDLRHPVQPPVLAPALRLCRAAPAPLEPIVVEEFAMLDPAIATLLDVDHVSQIFQRLGRDPRAGAAGRFADPADRRDRRPARPLGLRQVDAAAHHLRARRARPRGR